MAVIKFLQLVPYRFFYLLGLAVIVVGLPFSNLLMSQGLFYIAGAWLLSTIAFNNFKSRLKAYTSNKKALALGAILLLLLIGLSYTSNFGYALQDLRIKIPLFILPFTIVGLGSLSKKEYTALLAFFVAMVTLSAISGYVLCLQRYGANYEPRQLSPFISHIRLSLLIIMAVFICIYLMRQFKKPLVLIAGALVVAWLLFYLYKLESITGFAILYAAAFAALLVAITKLRSPMLRVGLPLAFLLIAIAIGAFYYSVYTHYFTPTNVPVANAKTAQGNSYDVVHMQPMIENGNLIWAYVCRKELEQEWPKLSPLHLDSADARGQTVYYTLLRYLSSKKLRKDAEGLGALTPDDVKQIEAGIANADYTRISNFRARFYKVLWEYQVYKAYHNPSGHSVFMRVEFWRAAAGIIAQNPIIGVGTGDVPDAYTAQYATNQTQLEPKWRLRAHNQFLAIGVGLGLVGMLLFVLSLFYLYISAKGYQSILFTVFFTTAVLSMLTEDTLETQAGITFYIFFFCLFLFLKPGTLPISPIGWGWWDKKFKS